MRSLASRLAAPIPAALALIAPALIALASTSIAAAPALPPVVPFADASRVVVIGGSLTEIVYALGAQDDIAARDLTGNYPAAAAKLPSIGYMRTLSPEGVLSVRPSAILAIEGSGPASALAVISKAGVPFDEVPDDFSREGIIDKVLAVGTALGLDGKAKALAGRLADELNAVGGLIAQVDRPKRVLFVLSLAGGQLTASGSGTAADGIIRMAGAVNAAAGFAGYKALDAEAIVAAQPDALLVMDNAGPPVTDDELFANPGVALTPAGRTHSVVHMDGEYLLGLGPRTPAALRDLVGRLYPGLGRK